MNVFDASMNGFAARTKGSVDKMFYKPFHDSHSNNTHKYGQTIYIDMVKMHTQMWSKSIPRYDHKAYTDRMNKHTQIWSESIHRYGQKHTQI